MGFRLWGPSNFAFGVAIRAVTIAALVWGAGDVAIRFHYYATALVLLAFAGLATANLASHARTADRILATFADGLAGGAIERPARMPAAFSDLGAAIDRAADRLDADRTDRQRRNDLLESMLDTVGAALFVIRPDGAIEQSNHAARLLAREAAARFTDIRVLGPDAVARVMALAPGGREILRLADGRRVLASVAGFALPGGQTRRLVSLQSVSGELAAVEVGAWQDLVRILAHEMMNSLTPIVSLAESLEDLLNDHPGASNETAAAVQVIARRSQGLMSFVDRYRKVAELPAPRRVAIHLSDLMAGLDQLFEPMLRARGVAYASEVRPQDLVLCADPEMLEQALVNLVKNAAEAVEGIAEPSVTIVFRHAEEGLVELMVSDNGRGLPDDLDRLFVPFFSTKTGGSGIGLNIARQVAIAHHGRALARRGAPRGAVFSLILPAGGG